MGTEVRAVTPTKVVVEEVVRALRGLDFISDAVTVGSFAAGERFPKDIDVLLTLNLRDDDLWKARRRIKGAITKVLQGFSNPDLLDVFVVTSDKVKWRLRPWVDERGKVSWDWE